MTLKISNLSKYINRATQTNTETTTTCKTPTKLEKICDQIVDSAIVGGITWLSVGATTAIQGNPVFSWEGFAFGFGLTFLIKMKEYRRIA